MATIAVVLNMHGNLRRFLPQGTGSVRLAVAPGSTVQTLIDGVGAANDVWLVAIDGRPVPFDRPLRSGDVVDCHAPIEGG